LSDYDAKLAALLRVTVLDSSCVTAVLRAIFATTIERRANMSCAKGLLAFLEEAVFLGTGQRAS
jgi:hypothetical protein